MGSIKDRNGMDLTEVEEIKKRWQEYTELYKKILKTGIATLCFAGHLLLSSLFLICGGYEA